MDCVVLPGFARPPLFCAGFSDIGRKDLKGTPPSSTTRALRLFVHMTFFVFFLSGACAN